MSESMVTGRMDSKKKVQVGRILKREGLNASQVINMLYDRILEEGSASFITGADVAPSPEALQAAFAFVDSLSEPMTTRFDTMTNAEVRADRLRARGLM